MELALLTFIAACWAVLGTGSVTSLVAWSGRGRARGRELERIWADYAFGKRYCFRAAAGEWPHVRAPRIEGRVGDVEVVIEACSMTIHGAPRPCTRVSGRALVAHRSRVVVSSDPALVQGPRVHGLGVLRLGDPFFDQVLTVRATSGEAAARLLVEPLRRALQGLLTSSYRLGLVFQLDEGDVSLTWLGEETRPAMLDEACAIVSCACGAGSSAGYR